MVAEESISGTYTIYRLGQMMPAEIKAYFLDTRTLFTSLTLTLICDALPRIPLLFMLQRPVRNSLICLTLWAFDFSTQARLQNLNIMMASISLYIQRKGKL